MGTTLSVCTCLLEAVVSLHIARVARAETGLVSTRSRSEGSEMRITVYP